MSPTASRALSSGTGGLLNPLVMGRRGASVERLQWIESGRVRNAKRDRSGSITVSQHERVHAQRHSPLGKPAIQGAKTGSLVSGDGEVQGVARPQGQGILIGKAGRGAEMAGSHW